MGWRSGLLSSSYCLCRVTHILRVFAWVLSGFSWVLRFPHIAQNHEDRWLGCAKLPQSANVLSVSGTTSGLTMALTSINSRALELL